MDNESRANRLGAWCSLAIELSQEGNWSAPFCLIFLSLFYRFFTVLFLVFLCCVVYVSLLQGLCKVSCTGCVSQVYFAYCSVFSTGVLCCEAHVCFTVKRRQVCFAVGEYRLHGGTSCIERGVHGVLCS